MAFQKKVTFTLIDQEKNANDRKNIVMSFFLFNQSESFAKSVNNENVEWGFPQFVSHENLLERHYILDDAIFLQVRVTPSI